MNSADESTPLVSFLLITYNQEAFIREAMEAAFAQTYRPLEIVVSDDCSTDRTFDIIEEMAAEYSGPHKLLVHRNEKNLGTGGNVNQVMKMASGDYNIVAAGDDISFPDRTQEIVNVWKEIGSPCVIYSDFTRIDSEGNTLEGVAETKIFTPSSALDAIPEKAAVAGCASSWSNDVYHSFGPINDEVVHEDMVLPFRCLLLEGKVHRLRKKLIGYRTTPGAWRKQSKSEKMSFVCYLNGELRARVLKQYRQDIQHRRDHLDREQELLSAVDAEFRKCQKLIKLFQHGLKLVVVERVPFGTIRKYLKLRYPRPFRFFHSITNFIR